MTMLFLFRRMAVLVALILVLAPTGLARAAELPAGWQLHTVGNYQIGAPGEWTNVALERADIERTIKVIAKGNPELAATLQKLVDSGQYKALKLFVIDPKSGANLTYAVTALPIKLTTKQVAAAAADMLPKQLPGVTILNTRSDLSLNGLAAARVEYDLGVQNGAGKTAKLRGVQYYIPTGTTLHVVTITGSPSTAFVKLADSVAGTFEQAQAAENAAAGRGTSRGGGNIRASGSVRAKIVGTLQPGESVDVLGKTKTASWFKIRTAKGLTGWASATILTVDATTVNKLPLVP